MNFSKNQSLFFLILICVLSIFIVDYFMSDSIINTHFLFKENKFVGTNNYENEVYFCPKDYCSKELIKNINGANESIDIAIYSFTLVSVQEALIDAKNRGVRVRIIFDYLQSFNQYSVDEKLIENGILIIRKNGFNGGAMHNKFIIIDNKKVLSGSFNYSKNGDENNNENLLLIFDKKLVEKYMSEFNYLWNSN